MGGVSLKLQKKIDEYMKEYCKDEYLVMEITKDTFGGTVENPTKAFYLAPYDEGFVLLSQDEDNQPEYE